MKFSHAWLEQYVDLPESPEEIGRRLTAAGVPLESIEWPGAGARDSGSSVYDFDIFSNRPDLMNHVGVAREIAAIYGTALRVPAPRVSGIAGPTTTSASVRIEAPDLCARYAARCVMGATVGPSPDWLRRRLESIGQRSINNIVDATNFVLWELGHPLHPFDLDRLADRTIIVRTARARERLVTLDGVERLLEPGMLVIADSRAPVALAGIMGGQGSQIGASTRNVLLESAWFDPLSIRRTSKTLEMHTDASHRFERGADPEAPIAALDRAAELVADVAGGEVTDPPIDERPRPATPRTVELRPGRVGSLLGREVPHPAMRTILERLGFDIRPAGDGSGPWQVRIPSFRGDVGREVDLIEEVARHHGYDAVPPALPLRHDAAGGRDDDSRLEGRVRSALLSAGLSEAVNFAMADAQECLLLRPEVTPPRIENPLQSGAASLRTTLLPGLLRNAAHNLNRSVPGCHLFEIGRVFIPGGGRPSEAGHVAGVLAGRSILSHWSLGRRDVDVFDARGVIENLAHRFGTPPPRFSSDRIAPGGSMIGLTVTFGDEVAGVVGEVAPAALRRFDIDRPVFAFEIAIESLRREMARERRFAGLPRYPAVRRDLAVVVSESVTVESIETTIRETSSVPVSAIEVFDRYRGKGIPEGRASVAVQVVFQHAERTLETDEVQKAQDAIVAALRDRLGARLRGGESD